MGATLDALHRLQEVELQIADIRRGIQRKARATAQHERQLAELEARHKTEHAEIRSTQMEADRLDLDVKSREADIAKLRASLQLTKTNKEYSALLTQLNTIKADSGKVEERVLTLLTQIDAKKKTLAEIDVLRAAEVARLEEIRATVRDAEAASKSRLDALMAEREKAATSVPPRALDLFNRISQKNDGTAMARVARTHPKRSEYACDGCNMSINIEQVNAILSRDEAITCNNCGCILYCDSPAATPT